MAVIWPGIGAFWCDVLAAKIHRIWTFLLYLEKTVVSKTKIPTITATNINMGFGIY